MPDRIYSVSYGGRIYDVQGPENADPNTIFAFLASQLGEGGEKKSAVEDIPVVGGILGQLADYPATFIEGLAGTGKTVTDVFGAGNAASEFLGDVAEGAHGMRSAESRAAEKVRAARSQAAEGKGTWEEIKAAGQNLIDAPLETISSLAGSALPFAASVLAAPETGGVSLAPWALAAASGVGMIKGDIYDAVLRRAQESGLSEDQAKAMAERAQEYGGENLDQIALGGVIGAVANATGVTKSLANLIGRRVAADVVEQQVERSVLSRMGRGFAKEGIPEGIQAGQERFAQNLAEQREGYDTDLWKGVAGQAAFEGLAGGIFGGGLGPFEGKRPAEAVPAAEEAGTPRLVPEEVIADDTAPPEERDALRQQAVSALAERYVAMGVSEDTALRAADAEITKAENIRAARAERAAAEEQPPAVEEPELGGVEPDIPSAGGPDTGEPIAPAPAAVEPEPVGGTVIPPVSAERVEGNVEPALTPEGYVDRYMAGEGRGETPADLEMQQYAANFPAEVEAEFARRQAPVEEAAPVAAAPEVDVTAPAPVEVTQTPKVELPADVQDLQKFTDEYRPGFTITYNPELKTRPYQFGIAKEDGSLQKVLGRSTSTEGLRKQILNQAPLEPTKVIDGVAVKKMPPGKAKGLEKPVKDFLSPEQVDPTIRAGKINAAQQEQVDLLVNEIDTARKMREITDGERTQLVDMLRTPTGKDLMRSPTWRVATNLQEQLDQLTKRGRELGKEQKRVEENLGVSLFEKRVKLTPEARQLKTEITDVSKTTNQLGAKLLETKKSIFDATRQQLSKFQQVRSDDIGKLRERRERAQRNFERGYLDQPTFNKVMRETEQQLRQIRPEPVRYRSGRSQAAGISLEELNTATKGITDNLHLPLKPVMVQSVEDLPSNLRAELEADDRTDAFGFTKGENVYLIAGNMHSSGDVAPTLFHEALGHIGLRRAFREGLDDVLNDIYRTNKKAATAADEWTKANPDLYAADEDPVARAVEEVLANASEGGPLSASKFDKLVRYIKNVIRQVFGVDLKLSDREVKTILAIAHEHAVEGKGEVSGSSATMYSRPSQEELDSTVAPTDEVADTDTVIGENMARIQTAADRIDEESYQRTAMQHFAEMVRGRDTKKWMPSLEKLGDQFRARGLSFLPTDGMLDYAETTLGKIDPTEKKEASKRIVAAMRETEDLVDRKSATKARYERQLAKVVKRVADFIHETGDNRLTDTMYYGMDYGVDMTALQPDMTAAEAYKTDNVWNRYNELLQDPALDKAKRADYQGKLDKRQGIMREALAAIKALAQTKDGLKVYAEVRDMYNTMHNLRTFLIEQRIENLAAAGVLNADTAKLIMDQYKLQFEKLQDRVNMPSKEDADARYPEVPLGLLHREYFPRKRYGDYWLRTKKTEFGEPILSFFESMAERDAELEKQAKAAGVRPTEREYFDYGNNAQLDLGAEELGLPMQFNQALNLLNTIDPQNFSESDRNNLSKQIYQLYLMSAPEGSLRKQFIKSKGRLGWSADIVRTVAESAEAYATELSRLEYGPQIDGSMRQTKSMLDGIPGDMKLAASDFLTELDRRATVEVKDTGEDNWTNKIVPWANHLAYITFLTSPATALVNTTALPIRVAPYLWSRHGLGPTMKAMGKWTSLIGAMPKLESAENAQHTFRQTTLAESKAVKNNPLYKRAMKVAADEYGLFQPLSAFVLKNQSVPESALEGKTAQVKRKVVDVASYLFDVSERFTREAAFLSAFDLEYVKAKAEGLSPAAAESKAIIAAKDAVNHTVGNYSQFNRPRALNRNDLTKALGMFKMYSVNTTRYLVTAANTMFDKALTKEERSIARKEFTGVMAMSFLFAGLQGLPLYTVGMLALQLLQDATDDDEDKRERLLRNPLTANSVEAQFLYEWLPEHFGTPVYTGEDGQKHLLSDVMLVGPLSEASGWNFGSKVSLDLAGLWFRSPKDTTTYKSAVQSAIVENIPGASATLNLAGMLDEFGKGNIEKGLEVGLPVAMLRSPLKAKRLMEEGLRSETGKVKLSPDKIGTTDVIGAAFGFNPTVVAKVQRENRDVMKAIQKFKDDRKEVMGRYTKAFRKWQLGDPDAQEALQEAWAGIEKFNQRTQNLYFAISYTDVYNSLRGTVAEGKYDVQGMGLTQEESYYAQRMLAGQ